MDKELKASTVTIPMKEIITLPELQSRVKVDEEVVTEYHAAITSGITMPCIDVVKLTDTEHAGKYVVVDGNHRLAALRKIGKKLKEVLVDCYEGTMADAVDLATAANKSHGLRRTNADKRRAIKMALELDTKIGRKRSDREIAEHLMVHHSSVSDIRAEMNGKPRRKKGEVSESASDGSGSTTAEKSKEDAAPPIDRDELGILIEDPKLLSIFQNAVEFDNIVGEINRVRGLVAQLAQTEAGQNINVQSLDFDIRGAADALKFARPYTICPYGPGCDKHCNACRGAGYVTRAIYERLDAAVRDNHERRVPGKEATAAADDATANVPEEPAVPEVPAEPVGAV